MLGRSTRVSNRLQFRFLYLHHSQVCGYLLGLVAIQKQRHNGRDSADEPEHDRAGHNKILRLIAVVSPGVNKHEIVTSKKHENGAAPEGGLR